MTLCQLPLPTMDYKKTTKKKPWIISVNCQKVNILLYYILSWIYLRAMREGSLSNAWLKHMQILIVRAFHYSAKRSEELTVSLPVSTSIHAHLYIQPAFFQGCDCHLWLVPKESLSCPAKLMWTPKGLESSKQALIQILEKGRERNVTSLTTLFLFIMLSKVMSPESIYQMK